MKTKANDFYLAGPMSGLPQFNFPAFYEAAAHLRDTGWGIVSPAELDDEDTKNDALKSAKGNPADQKKTWADFLARDIKIVVDKCVGIVFLPNWFLSRGARLEAYCACLQEGYDFYEYLGTTLYPRRISRSDVLATIWGNS